jgi:3-hydroxyisobutyrate dehydrogenase-like beta-hydroxyacid dehydrogenase
VAVDGGRPVFETFSKHIVHMGQIGTGQYGKLFNNTLMMTNHKNISGVLALAQDWRCRCPSWWRCCAPARRPARR